MSRRFTFRKKDRLKSRKAIEALFLNGKSVSQFPLRVVYQFILLPGDLPSSMQAGVTVSKRHFKKASDRNRIKRLMREAYRLQKSALTETILKKHCILHLFFMYADKTLPEFETIKISMAKCLNILQQAADKNENSA